MNQSSASDLSHTIIPKSDQLNADQLLSASMTITVTEVSLSDAADQPVIVHYEGENGRPFKPCKTMRKLLVAAWGKDGREWAGRSMTLYNDPAVKFGGMDVGGIRISHLSHIERDIRISLTSTKGKKALYEVKRMAAPPSGDSGAGKSEALISADQVKTLETLCENKGIDIARLCKIAKVEQLKQLAANRYQGALDWLNKAENSEPTTTPKPLSYAIVSELVNKAASAETLDNIEAGELQRVEDAGQRKELAEMIAKRRGEV